MNSGDPGARRPFRELRCRLAFARVARRLAIVATYQYGRATVTASDRVARDQDTPSPSTVTDSIGV